jgi:hypothetical protein
MKLHPTLSKHLFDSTLHTLFQEEIAIICIFGEERALKINPLIICDTASRNTCQKIKEKQAPP